MAHMSQGELASAIHKTEKSVANWEAGGNLPRDLVDVAQAVGMVTGVPASWLLGLEPADYSQFRLAA